ncbi:MAG TPA: hypothetical protein DDW91_14735 [Shewanella frigidimarina]|nr:hypothetical protein [Shewanella frigidimarina]
MTVIGFKKSPLINKECIDGVAITAQGRKHIASSNRTITSLYIIENSITRLLYLRAAKVPRNLRLIIDHKYHFSVRWVVVVQCFLAIQVLVNLYKSAQMGWFYIKCAF